MFTLATVLGLHVPACSWVSHASALESRRIMENEYRRKLENGNDRNIEPYPRGRRLLENESRRLLG